MRFEQGNNFGNGRPKGSKNKKTLEKEKLRALFDEKMSESFDVLINAQIKDSIKDYRARHYVFDQMIGKSKESVEISGKENSPIQLDIRIQTALKKVYGN